jgi:endonuclease G
VASTLRIVDLAFFCDILARIKKRLWRAFALKYLKVIIFALLLSISLTAAAHRSGCHRWHSCPSDRGTYTCGDTGQCSGCPDNEFCQGGSPRSGGASQESNQPVSAAQSGFIGQPSVPLEEANRKVLPAVAGTENLTRQGNILQVDYEGFTVWVDCAKRGPTKFRYTAQHDGGNAKRYTKFMLDTKVPAACQQNSAKAYGHGYDRGHQVPANHLDASDGAIKQTNYMTNILPQASQMNRGAWLETEEIVECYRDIDELLVLGGVIWGQNPADDYFLKSHGVETPDAFWKVIIRGTGQDERAIAWIVPNTAEATRKNLDRYLVSIDELERVIGEKIPVADYVKHDKPSASWMIPMGCNKS